MIKLHQRNVPPSNDREEHGKQNASDKEGGSAEPLPA